MLIEGATIITDFLKEKFMKRTKTPSEAAHIASLLYNFQTLESVENYSQGRLEDHERRLEYQRLSVAFLFRSPCHSSTFFLPRFPLQVCKSKEQEGQVMSFMECRYCQGKHFLPLRPLLPKTWSLAWWVGMWSWRAVRTHPELIRASAGQGLRSPSPLQVHVIRVIY